MELLGRGLVLSPGKPVAEPWQGAPRVRVDENSGSETVAVLHRHWLTRTPVVVELAVSKAWLKEPQRLSTEPYELEPGFEFTRERLHFLVWANNYDGTGDGEPIWWHSRLSRNAAPEPDLWRDGGPRGTLDLPVLHRESIESGTQTLTQLPRASEAELAPDQRRAVTHRGGAACILAPAGSGKTRVLISRLQYLLDCGFEPERITAVAYNRRAALEMKARLPGCPAHIVTLHALGYRLLRTRRNVQVASEAQVRGLLKQCWKVEARLNQDPWQPYLEALQQARLGLRQPEEVEAARGDVAGFAAGFPRYRELLEQRGWIDHDEQIYGALQLLLADPELRKQAQRSCTHMLVDEFQDLTPAFLLLVRLLAAPAYQVFGVGDDDQVIYGYAGANPEFLVHYERYFPGAAAYHLEVNYRCPGPVVECANQLLRKNRVRVPKATRSGALNGSANPVLHLLPPEDWTEASQLTIASWLKNTPTSQIAVLARVNALLMPLQVRLKLAGIPHTPVVNTDMLHRTGIRTALAYLRLALTPDRMRPDDLYEALRRPSRKLRREIIDQCCQAGTLKKLLFLSTKLDPWPEEQVAEFVHDIRQLGRAASGGTAAFFAALRRINGLLESLGQLDGPALGAAGSSHLDDLIALQQVAPMHADPGTFQDWLTEQLEPQTSDNGVRLSSIHRVKGLEWDYVLLYGVQTGLMPHRLNPDVEEERRVFHVALTRCRKEVVLLCPPDATLSPFVGEMHAAPNQPGAQKKKKKKKRK